MRLAGRTAIVTGAGSGIGRASAVLFAKEGAFVALVDRDRAGLQETLAAIEGANGEASLHVGDVGEADFAKAIVGDVMARRGRLDVLMAAAGFSCGGTVLTTDPADWDAVFRTNVGGTWLWSRAAVPEMQRQGSGSIITLGVATRDRRRQGQQRLYRREGRDHQPDPDHGAGFRHGRHPRQCDRAGRHRHADAAAQFCPSRRPGAGARSVAQPPCHEAIWRGGGGGRGRAPSRQRCVFLYDRHRDGGRWRLARGMNSALARSRSTGSRRSCQDRASGCCVADAKTRAGRQTGAGRARGGRRAIGSRDRLWADALAGQQHPRARQIRGGAGRAVAHLCPHAHAAQSEAFHRARS